MKCYTILESGQCQKAYGHDGSHSLRIGIPYAFADYDAHGYNVVCPECGAKFYGKGRTEDAITKGAGQKYATHYTANHEGA